MSAETPQAPKGTFDLLPPEGGRLDALETVFATLARRYGYRRIVTPTFEHTDVFLRVGEATDIVRKEMYTFDDRGGRSLTLRPEGTAGVVRAFVEHGLARKEPLPWKVFYSATNFRYEQPQRGRTREHYQVGVEAVGDGHPDLDVEVVDLAMSFLGAIGADDVVLLINSMGDQECRPEFLELFGSFLAAREGELCEECRARLAINPLRVLDCKKPGCRAATDSAPRLVDNLCDPCGRHFDSVQQGLKELGWDARLEPRLVRGLDYYTRTTFEMQSSALDAAQNALGGGGRYDGLVEQLGGDPLPGVGFGLGAVPRILLAAGGLPGEPSIQVAVLDLTAPGSEGRRLVGEIRRAGLSADAPGRGRSMKAQFRAAERSGAAVAVIVGDEEMSDGTVTVKDMRDGSQERVARPDLTERLLKVTAS